MYFSCKAIKISSLKEIRSKMVSTRLQSNSSSSNSGDGSLPSCSDVNSSKGKETKFAVPTVSTRLQSNNSADMMPLSIDVSAKSSGCVTRSNTTVNNQVAVHSKENQSKANLNLLDLPTEIIQKIVSYLGFKTAANIRTVCVS